MWIKTKDGDAVNMALVAHITVQEYWKNNFAVEVTDANEKGVYIATFDSKTDAENYVTVLVEELNGNKPVGYAFSWLSAKNAKIKHENDVKSAAKVKFENDVKSAMSKAAMLKHKDEILTDGQWF